MKVKATGEFKKIGVWPAELNGYIPEAGYEFEVSEERYNVLKGNNSYHAEFVQAVDIDKEPVIIETSKKEVETEKAVKTTKKTTKTTTKKAK